MKRFFATALAAVRALESVWVILVEDLSGKSADKTAIVVSG